MEREAFLRLLWFVGVALSSVLLLLYFITLSRLFETGSGLIYLD